MKKKIVLYTDQKLRKKSTNVFKITNSVKRLAKDMLDTMKSNGGMGLSAIQIGKPKRIIVYEYTKSDESKDPNPDIPQKILINPKIISLSSNCTEDEEGCLSFPKLYGVVKRSDNIKIEALDIDGNKLELNAKGLEARVIQHEIDHLDGILFIDHLKNPDELYTYEIK